MAVRALTVLVLFASAAFASDPKQKPPQDNSGPAHPPPGAILDARSIAQNPDADDGQWTLASKDFQNTRFSGLRQLNAGNVKDLKLQWTWATGLSRGHEGAPLVVGDTMYFVTPFPNKLYAFDLGKAGGP